MNKNTCSSYRAIITIGEEIWNNERKDDGLSS